MQIGLGRYLVSFPLFVVSIEFIFSPISNMFRAFLHFENLFLEDEDIDESGSNLDYHTLLGQGLGLIVCMT